MENSVLFCVLVLIFSSMNWLKTRAHDNGHSAVEKIKKQCIVAEINVSPYPNPIKASAWVDSSAGGGGAGGTNDTSFQYLLRIDKKKGSVFTAGLVFKYRWNKGPGEIAEDFVVKKKFNISPQKIKILQLSRGVKVKSYFESCIP